MKKLIPFLVLGIATVACVNSKTIIEIDKDYNFQIISLPFELSVRSAIGTEDKFDAFDKDLIDSITLRVNNQTMVLGQELDQPRVFDIRVKIIFRGENGNEERIFIQRSGDVMYKGGIYDGSEQIDLLMARIDSARIANGAPN